MRRLGWSVWLATTALMLVACGEQTKTQTPSFATDPAAVQSDDQGKKETRTEDGNREGDDPEQ